MLTRFCNLEQAFFHIESTQFLELRLVNPIRYIKLHYYCVVCY